MNKRIIACVLCMAVLVTSCIFSPDDGEKKPKPVGQWVDPTTPEKVVQNLEVAFSQLDIDFYERCLHENFFYRSPSDTDELDIYWSRSIDVASVGNIFDNTRDFIFTPSRISKYEEYGKNVPNIPGGAIIEEGEEHPDEIWHICEYYITMDISTVEYGLLRVQQDMKFKMVEDPETKLFSIVRWVDDNQLTN